MENYIITISREFASMGRTIASILSEKLGIEYYDRDIVDQAAKKLKLPISVVDQEEEKAVKQAVNPFSRMIFPLGKGTSNTQDKIFDTQKNIIQFLSEKNNCIIVGRCSDFILSDVKNSLHIYIYASYEARLEHCIKDLGLEEQEARRMIKSVDEARNSYHMQYAGYLPDDKRYKDILIDSSFFGVKGTAEFLAEAVKKKFYD